METKVPGTSASVGQKTSSKSEGAWHHIVTHTRSAFLLGSKRLGFSGVGEVFFGDGGEEVLSF